MEQLGVRGMTPGRSKKFSRRLLRLEELRRLRLSRKRKMLGR
jgi:hypothetical protein